MVLIKTNNEKLKMRMLIQAPPEEATKNIYILLICMEEANYSRNMLSFYPFFFRFMILYLYNKLMLMSMLNVLLV